MYKSLSTVLIWSENSAKLAKWYEKVYWFATFYDPENNILQLVGGK